MQRVGHLHDSDEVLHAGLETLSHALWQQRARLEQLAFKARVAQLVMAGDDQTMVPRAIDELERANRALRASDHEPDRLLRAIFRHLGVPPTGERTLRALIALVPPSWQDALEEHAAGLAATLTRLDVVRRENRQLSWAGLGNTRALIGMATRSTSQGDSGTYDRSGRAVDEDRIVMDALI